MVRGVDEATQQRDAADEGRLETSGSIIVGAVIVDAGKVVRPSQLIASVGQTWKCATLSAGQ
jgi:pyrimidine deaminase RibD-like protein